MQQLLLKQPGVCSTVIGKQQLDQEAVDIAGGPKKTGMPLNAADRIRIFIMHLAF